jgi:hypothetical protein
MLESLFDEIKFGVQWKSDRLEDRTTWVRFPARPGNLLMTGDDLALGI